MKYLRSLGWVLRNHKTIQRIEVRDHSRKSLEDPWAPEAYVIFHGERVCGRTAKRQALRFEADYVSTRILWGFLGRPIFRGLPLNWFGTKVIIGDAAFSALPLP